MKGKLLLMFLIMLVLVQTSMAAIIQGVVYDWELNPVKNVIIEVDTVPKQTVVAKNGDYILTLGEGDFTIKAKATDGTETIEKITVVREGTYTLDIIMLPGLDDPDELFNESDFEIEEDPFVDKSDTINYVIAGVSLVVLLLLLVFIFKVKKKAKEINQEVKVLKEEIEHKEVDLELEKVINAIKEVGGRISQKDLRKKFPSSEAKVSLMITELEKKGVLEKIKKGRGNVLILK